MEQKERILLTDDSILKSRHAKLQMLNFLKLAIEAKLNIAIIGQTGSGKTTLLNYLAGHLPKSNLPKSSRFFVLESASESELCLLERYPDLCLIEKQNTHLGQYDTFRYLLATQSDYIIADDTEFSLDEAYTNYINLSNVGYALLTATNANSIDDYLYTALSTQKDNKSLSKYPTEVLAQRITDSVDLIVHQDVTETGHYFIREIAEPQSYDGGKFFTNTLSWSTPSALTSKNSNTLGITHQWRENFSDKLVDKIRKRTGTNLVSSIKDFR